MYAAELWRRAGDSSERKSETQSNSPTRALDADEHILFRYGPNEPIPVI